MIISVFDRVENVVGKGENASYLHPVFSKRFIVRLASFNESNDCEKWFHIKMGASNYGSRGPPIRYVHIYDQS